MIKILDLYLIRNFFQALLVVTVALSLTIIVINMVEELRDFFDHDVGILQIGEYYLYFGGWVIKTFLPMFVQLAILFSVSMMARKNEVLAMKAGGRSLYRVAAPFFIVTLFIAGGHFYYNEFIFPPANKKKVEMKTFIIEARSKKIHQTATKIYRQISEGYYYTIENFNIVQNKGTVFRMIRFKDNELQELVVSDQIIYADFAWKAINGEKRSFQDDQYVSFNSFDTLQLPDIADRPVDFARRIGKPEDMGLVELENYIDLMKRTGGPYVHELVDLKIKYSFPLASVIVVLICIPLAATPKRGGVAISFALGTLIALTYFVLFRLAQSAAYSEKIPIELGVWGVNGLFFLTGIVLMVSARK